MRECNIRGKPDPLTYVLYALYINGSLGEGLFLQCNHPPEREHECIAVTGIFPLQALTPIVVGTIASQQEGHGFNPQLQQAFLR